MLPEVEHWSNSYEIVEYLRDLERSMPSVEFEVGMSTRSRRWVFRRRVTVGAQFLMVGPVMDPVSVQPMMEHLELRPDDPPVYLEVTPPFSDGWVRRLESVGAVPIGDQLRDRLAGLAKGERRAEAWRVAREVAQTARGAGFAGMVLMGLRFETAVGEAYDAWHA
jgi:5,10-methylenetetrahydrofolate reductase